MKPVFTIITVTYNAERWIERTILSITGQTYKGIEYIIIDGNSTDGTVDILKKYTGKISKWISEPDNGLYDAMNKGLKEARGDFVWFINAGDTIYKTTTISEMVDAMSILPDIIYGDTEIVDEDDKSLGMRRLHISKPLTWKSFRMGMLVSHQSFIVKREIAPMYDIQYRYSADVDWCIKCLKKAQSTMKWGILSCYLNEGLTTANRKASLKERYVIMCKYYGTLPTIMRHIWFAMRFYWAKYITGKV